MFVSTTKAPRARVSAVRELHVQLVNTAQQVCSWTASAPGRRPVDVAEIRKFNDSVTSCSSVIMAAAGTVCPHLPSVFVLHPGFPASPAWRQLLQRDSATVFFPKLFVGEVFLLKEMLYMQYLKNC